MSVYCSIHDTAEKVRRRWKETDVYGLCRAMNIGILYKNLGTAPGAIKGFFTEYSRCRRIILNADLPETLQRIICAHEIGHAVLHRRSAGIKAFHEYDIFNAADRLEYEANIFAAELLLTDSAVEEVLQDEELSFFQAAAELNVPPELLDFKFRSMKDRGYFLQPLYLANGDFLKNIEQKR